MLDIIQQHQGHDVWDAQGLLGDAKAFKLEFEKRITAGNDKNATGRDRQIATAKAAELRAQIAPFFLRREKKDVLPSNNRHVRSYAVSLSKFQSVQLRAEAASSLGYLSF